MFAALVISAQLVSQSEVRAYGESDILYRDSTEGPGYKDSGEGPGYKDSGEDPGYKDSGEWTGIITDLFGGRVCRCRALRTCSGCEDLRPCPRQMEANYTMSERATYMLELR